MNGFILKAREHTHKDRGPVLNARACAHKDRGPLANARARLRDNHGFMLAEQLMSILLVGFLAIVVAAGLGVCISVQRDISIETSSQALLSRAIQEVNDQLEFSTEVQDDASTNQSASFVSSSMHQQVKLSSVQGEGIYLTRTDSPEAKTLLVGESSGYVAVFGELPTYNKTTNTWSYTVKVVDGSGNEIKSQKVAVKRIASAGYSN